MRCFILLSLAYIANCLTVYESGISEKDAEYILHLHNKLRLMVAQGQLPNQPKAANLKRLKYDEELAAKAQEISGQCVKYHVKVADTRWTEIGQNLYWKMSKRKTTGTDWNRAINKWFQEHRIYNFSNKHEPRTGHYTQIVGGLTEYVGCGYAMCKSKLDSMYTKLYVCNYGPQANYDSLYPYETGNGCEDLC